MALPLSKTVFEFVKTHPEEKFTARQIAEWMVKTYPDEARKKQERSKAKIIPLDSAAAVIQQYVAEIGAQRPQIEKQFPQLKTIDSRPLEILF